MPQNKSGFISVRNKTGLLSDFVMKIRVQQINAVVGDIPGNADAVLAALKLAEQEVVDLLVLPELVICGYPPMDLVERKSFLQAVYRQTGRIVESTKETGLLFGTLRPNNAQQGRPVCNVALLAHRGKAVDEISKTLLPTYDVFDEFRYFEPNREIRITEWAGHKWGITVCEDIWNNQNEYNDRIYDVDPAAVLKSQGAEILINISASPFTREKPEMREEMLQRNARRLEMPVIYANQVGANSELIFDGNSSVISADGEVVLRLATFQEDRGDIFWKHSGSGKESVPGRGSGPGKDSKPGKDLNSGKPSDPVAITTPNQVLKTFPGREERLFKALALGLHDYIEKSRMPKRVVMGLSGGIDSALTAVIAQEAFGAENVMGITMPSPYSSEGSVTDSEKLARNLGITIHELSIKEIYHAFLNTLKPVFGQTEFGVAEENLQSRSRGTILMGISNKFGHMLLNTGNKSELAVGYCTLYGDMAGGLSMLSDIYKTEVYTISRWVNETCYGREVIPWNTIEKPPSAELRPGQKDTDTLPDYKILDGILQAYIENQCSAEQIVKAGFSKEKVRQVIRMVDRNEYKRRQAAPGLRVSAKAFGMGRRLPIVQRWTEM